MTGGPAVAYMYSCLLVFLDVLCMNCCMVRKVGLDFCCIILGFWVNPLRLDTLVGGISENIILT